MSDSNQVVQESKKEITAEQADGLGQLWVGAAGFGFAAATFLTAVINHPARGELSVIALAVAASVAIGVYCTAVGAIRVYKSL